MLAMCLMLACAAEPEWPVRQIEPGHVTIYTGEIQDHSDRPGKMYRHAYSLDVTIVVLSIREGVVECAVQTSVTPNPAQSITNATIQISGITPRDLPTAIHRIEIIRILTNNTIQLAELPKTEPPFANRTFVNHPEPPLDGTWLREIGPLLRTGLDWTSQPDELWNGSRVLDRVGRKSSKGFEDITQAVAGWRRTDRFFVSPTDGLTRAYSRRIEQREGKQIIGTVETKLTMKAPPPVLDAAALKLARREAEWAMWFGADIDRVVRDSQSQAQFRERVKRSITGQPSIFRPALESLAK